MYIFIVTILSTKKLKKVKKCEFQLPRLQVKSSPAIDRYRIEK